jgi:hypothetical protein
LQAAHEAACFVFGDVETGISCAAGKSSEKVSSFVTPLAGEGG